MMQQKFFVLTLWILCIIALFFGSINPNLAPNSAYNLDKLLHFLAYTLIALPPAYIIRKIRAYIFLAISLFALSAVIELVQSTVPNRQASIDDLIANTLGILTGIMIMVNLRKHLKRKSHQTKLHTSL